MRGARHLVSDVSRLPAPAGDGRHEQVRGRREPGADAGVGGAAHRGLRADPVRAADRAGPRGAAALRPADDQQVLRARPRARPQHDRALRRGRASRCSSISWRNPGEEQGHFDLDTYARAVLEARDAVAEITGQPSVHLNARVLGRDHRRRRCSATSRLTDRLGGDREPDAARRARSTTSAPGRRRAFVNRELAAAAVAESARTRLPRRAGAGRRVHVAAAERPGVELRRQQLPARQGPAGVRRPVLEPGHGPARRRPAPRLHAALARELARAARRAARCSERRSTSARSTSTATSSPGSTTTSSRGRTPTGARSCWAARRGSCSPRAATSRRSINPPSPESRASYRVADEHVADAGGVARAAADAARELVARLRRVAARALRASSSRLPPSSAAASTRRVAKAPGSYVHAN